MRAESERACDDLALPVAVHTHFESGIGIGLRANVK